MKYLFALLLPVLLFASCSSEGLDGQFMPKARGAIGEIILVMDTSLWKSELGEEMRETFEAEAIGLPRSEQMFTLRFIDPDKLNSVLKNGKNMIFVTTLAENTKMLQFFTKASIENIKSNPDLYMQVSKDVFARGQDVMQLYGQNEQTLIKNIRENRDKIRGHFEILERRRLISEYLEFPREKGIEKTLLDQYSYEMAIPKGFQIAQQESNFIWLRDVSKRDIDLSIFITSRPYSDESLFKGDTLVYWRDEIAKNYLYGDPEDTATYVSTEMLLPFYTRALSLNDQYAVELRGVWKTNGSVFMGGPYLGYSILDEQRGRQIYVEGFLYSPKVDQRELMKRVEAILWTFQPVSAELSNR